MTNPLHVALVLLAVATGAADAFAFLLLGGIFTANMTGNLVLAGMFTRPGWSTTLVGALTAIVAFAAAAAVAFRVTPRPRAGTVYAPRAVVTLAVPIVVLQLGFALAWLLTGGDVPPTGSCTLIAVSAAALGAQTVLAKRVSGAAGLTTTFVTGTLTAIVEALADGQRGSLGLQWAVVAAVTVGALIGTAVVAVLPLAAPFVPLALVGTATLLLVGVERTARVGSA
jgi:uncharacterized membrane protein YoaK (UPF0700 family)